MKRILLAAVSAFALHAAAHAQQGNPVNLPSAAGIGPCSVFGSTAGTCAQGSAVRPLNSAQFYVNGSSGSDSNACTAAGSSACLTIRGALVRVFALDLNHTDVTINIAAGTYDESILIAGPNAGATAGATNGNINGARIVLSGAGSGATSIAVSAHCSPGYGDAITVSNGAAVLVGGLTLSTACTNRSDIFVQNNAYVGLLNSDVVLGTAGATAGQIHVEALGIFEASVGFSISGSAGELFEAVTGGFVELDKNGYAITCIGNPAYSIAFALAKTGAHFSPGNVTFTSCSGVTGPKYLFQSGASIHASVSWPGDSAGTQESGATYITSTPVFLPGSHTPTGNHASPTDANTVLQLYHSSATDWGGFGSDSTNHNLYAAVGASGALLVPFLIGGSGGVSAGNTICLPSGSDGLTICSGGLTVNAGGVTTSAGSAAAPSLAFLGNLTDGLYDSGSQINFSIAGAQVGFINASNLTLQKAGAPQITSLNTTSGATGGVGSFAVNSTDSTGTVLSTAKLQSNVTNSTHGSVQSTAQIQAYVANTLTSVAQFGSTITLTGVVSAANGLLNTVVTSTKTTAYPVVVADSGKYFDNIGAGGEVDFTLPTAAAGLQFCFGVSAAQTVKVIAPASTSIAIGANNSATAGNITNATAFGEVCLYAQSTTQYVARSSTGTWAVN